MSVRPDEIPEPEPFGLDGVIFIPLPGDVEDACRDGVLIGSLGIDDVYTEWQARKGDGEFKLMRCRAEARAFLVSAVKQ